MNRTDINKLMTKFEDAKKLPLIEVHKLVPIGPSLLNRDSNGRVKTIKAGGTSRVRISSAAQSRPIRVAEYTDNAVHSRYLPQKVAQKLEAMGKDEAYIKAVLAFLGDKGKGTGQILAFSDYDVTVITEAIVNSSDDAKFFSNKTKAAALLKKIEDDSKKRSIDNTTALMGRMSTDVLLDTIEAARHISHMYSIDRWYGDNDTFTAVDDLKSYVKEPDFMKWLNNDVSDTGSAFFDANDIAANVMYGYTSISTRTLLENKLRNIDAADQAAIDKAIDESKEIVRRYITDYLLIAPSAKQTSSATTPRPLAVLITAGTRVYPMTADTDFEKVVKATESNSVGDIGVQRLVKFAEDLTGGTFAVNEYQKMFWLSDVYKEIPSNCESASLNDALNCVTSMIGE
ncbi:type I-E CRISPR-associated protein Cas7/Cse4/CasC [Butyrivibrio sp. AE3006]|uniref:type I-E CRISPR-associated protein Cas7/Cse4/CasC n=1 Tax=Butyrivibrio sp. AE3006 TaxID=1280673 RepID=UPI000413AFDC|nr:type I-E CRISPR-associated protein Cas7/Cse4/CasC [Butyrivibrio sp. AE3006]